MAKQTFNNPNWQGFFVLVAVVAIGGLYLFNNRRPTQSIRLPAPAASPTRTELESWQVALQQELQALPSLTPTQALPPTLPATATFFVPPVITSESVVQPAASNLLASFTPLPPELVTPSPAFIQSTPVPLPDGVEVAAIVIEDNPLKFQLPPEQIPLSLHPFDHYYFARPIDVTANSRSLFYYPYGSSGSQNWRVHHGLDMPNLVGQPVRAAAAGTIVWASQAYETEVDGDLEVYSAYGNVVVIEHHFGWGGQKLWTLYAHLSAITVRQGDRVELGDTIGLVGTTGNVTGPHVHFEVRVGRNSYYSTRNPLLWMAPYIGHGVVAGRVVDGSGQFVDAVLVQLNANGRLVDSTTTYENPYAANKRVWSVVPDDNWNENFVLGDVEAGQYQLVAVVNEERFFQTIQVNAGVTTFVEIKLNELATPQSVPPTAIQPTSIPTAVPSATPKP